MGDVDLSELHEVKADVKLLLAQGAETKALLQEHIKSNDAAHGRMQVEIDRNRDSVRDLYEKRNDDKKEFNIAITAVRRDGDDKIDKVEGEIAAVKAAPGERAQKVAWEVGKILLTLVIGALFTALIFWLQSGGSSP